MADMISDFLNQYGGQIVSTGLNALLTSNSAAQGNAALTNLGAVNTDAMKAMIEGYGGQLKAREDLMPKLDQAIGVYGTDRTTGVANYSDANTGMGNQYSTSLDTARDSAVDSYTTGGTAYNTGVGGGLNTSADTIKAGYAGLEESLNPYIDGGEAGLNYLNQQMGIDPSSLTPSQQRAMDKYIRDANARLSSSGLRGAGRAGVAAVNEGVADLGATFYDQNLARQGAAASALNSMGYGASGAVATGRKNMGETIGTLEYGTAEKQAENARSYANKVGDLTLNTAKDTATTKLNLGQKAADQTLNAATDVAREKLLTKSSAETALSNARSDTAGNIANARAKALVTGGNIDAAKAAVDNYAQGSTYRDILNIFTGSKPPQN